MASIAPAQQDQEHEVDANSIRAAYERLAPFIVNTPVVH